ncbi:hypothetical protein B0H13DRAFT_2551365 [Mycena leptocephala]|nr:hypothetical protein B0H13DRAFT_2551365 [Mycena leptocephala]
MNSGKTDRLVRDAQKRGARAQAGRKKRRLGVSCRGSCSRCRHGDSRDRSRREPVDACQHEEGVSMAHERRMRNSCGSEDNGDGRGGGSGEDPGWEDDGVRATKNNGGVCRNWHHSAGDAGIERNAAQREAGSGRSSGGCERRGRCGRLGDTTRKRYRLSHRLARLVATLVDKGCRRRLRVFVFDVHPALSTPRAWRLLYPSLALPRWNGRRAERGKGSARAVLVLHLRVSAGDEREGGRSGHRIAGGAEECGWYRRRRGAPSRARSGRTWGAASARYSRGEENDRVVKRDGDESLEDTLCATLGTRAQTRKRERFELNEDADIYLWRPAPLYYILKLSDGGCSLRERQRRIAQGQGELTGRGDGSRIRAGKEVRPARELIWITSQCGEQHWRLE